MKTIAFDLDGTLVNLKPVLTCIADMSALKALRSKYNFALVSGSSRAEVEWALQETGLAPLFDTAYVVSKDDAQGNKASGEPFRELQRRVEGQVVMIGDSDSDEAGTTVAEIPFVRVKDSLQSAITEAVEKLKTL